MASERVQQARMVLYNRESPHAYETYREHLAQLDELVTAARAEAEAEWREAVEAALPYFVAGNLVVNTKYGNASLLRNERAAAALARLRALIEDSPPPKEDRGG